MTTWTERTVANAGDGTTFSVSMLYQRALDGHYPAFNLTQAGVDGWLPPWVLHWRGDAYATTAWSERGSRGFDSAFDESAFGEWSER